MKNILVYLKWIPEFYFILASLLWFYVSVQNQSQHVQSVINFPAVIMIVLFHIQLFLNDHLFGKFLAAITAIGSLALILTYSFNIIDFKHLDYSAQILILKLGNLALLSLIMAVLMYIKYKDPVQEHEAEFIEN